MTLIFTYTITVVNTGRTVLTGLVVTDTLTLGTAAQTFDLSEADVHGDAPTAA